MRNKFTNLIILLIEERTTVIVFQFTSITVFPFIVTSTIITNNISIKQFKGKNLKKLRFIFFKLNRNSS